MNRTGQSRGVRACEAGLNRKLFEEPVKVVDANDAVAVIGYFSIDMKFPLPTGERAVGFNTLREAGILHRDLGRCGSAAGSFGLPDDQEMGGHRAPHGVQQ